MTPSTPQLSPELSVVRQRCRRALDRVRAELLSSREPGGHWCGELAASALSTATAVSAIAAVLLNSRSREDEPALRELLRRGMGYLRGQQNDDGGFGDTDRSHSNIATSYLVLSASELSSRVGEDPLGDAAVAKLNAYLDGAGRLDGLRRRYGKDKTFVVPIMNNMAIAGLIGWDQVAALPFEAAVFPQSMYRFLRMPVVSYAIPALVAIGQARHFLGRRAFFPLRWIRHCSIGRTLDVLRRMQPESGGYLEATPLTSFVVMSLAATGRCDLQVVREGLRFLVDSVREEGSWPIDTNLATWATSLSIHALACDPDDAGEWYQESLVDWHLGCQHRRRHPFTGAEPGGWGWTDLSGAVPDSDDTPAAMLALGLMRDRCDTGRQSRIDEAVRQGAGWLCRLQNRNGGWPTFCRGWGKLPFDRSSTDLTAHAMRALRCHQRSGGGPAPSNFATPLAKGARFLLRQQHRDGCWVPLWFGNQDRSDESNPIYGTAKVLIAGGIGAEAETRAVEYLLAAENADGGWGGGASVGEKLAELKLSDPQTISLDPNIPEGIQSSVEETALAVEALATRILSRRQHQFDSAGDSFASDPENKRSDRGRSGLDGSPAGSVPGVSDVSGGAKLGGDAAAAGYDPSLAAILRGVEFLVDSVEDRRHAIAWPIGFYFAKLWYHERLYPLIFTAAALGKFLRATDDDYDPHWPR